MSEHRIPAVDRAIEVLDFLGRAARPVGLRELAAELGVPRSTVYRLINSLEAGEMVVKAGEQVYVLGSAIKRLAQAVPQGFDLVSLARPTLDLLAIELQLQPPTRFRRKWAGVFHCTQVRPVKCLPPIWSPQPWRWHCPLNWNVIPSRPSRARANSSPSYWQCATPGMRATGANSPMALRL